MKPLTDNSRLDGAARASAPDRAAAAELIGAAAARVCCHRFGDALEALILTGSHARGEGSLVRRGAQWQVVGDAEFLAILRGGPQPSAAEVSEMRGEIERALAKKGTLVAVSLAVGERKYLRNLRPRIFSYELCHHGRVVHGNSHVLETVPLFAAADIPLEDGWRMLSNRLLELCESIVNRGNDDHSFCYSAIKLRLDIATSFLLFAQGYRPSYTERAEELRKLAGGTATESPWGHLEAVVSTVEACTRWKLSPADCPCEGVPREFAADVLRDACQLWAWELQKMCAAPAGAGPEDLMSRMMRLQTMAERARGWMSVWRRHGWAPGLGQARRWVSLARRGSPRYCVYSVVAPLAKALHAELRAAPSEALDLPRLCAMLPVVSGECTTLTGLARQLAASYHRFLEGTVS